MLRSALVLALSSSLCAGALVLGVAACDDDDPPPAAAGSEVAEPLAEAEEALAEPAEDAEGQDPCELLTEAVLRRVFELPAETTVTKSATTTPRPICTYNWEKPNAEEIRAEIQKKQQETIREMMQKMRRGKRAQSIVDTIGRYPSTDARVSLNFGSDFETEEEARAGYEESLRFMREGVTRMVESKALNEDITFRADHVPVEGVGDRASWAQRMNQLAILSGRRILFLSVEMETEPADNLEPAKRLAAALLAE